MKRKACSVCGKKKLITEYHVCRANRDNLDSRCKTCEKERHQLRRKLEKTARPKPDVCECCEEKTTLFPDHDHVTKKFRGWLCKSCNSGLGQLGDTLEGVMKAVRYLEKHDLF